MFDIQTLDGKLVLHPADALVAIGWSTNRDAAAKTARNLICGNKFPIRVIDVCGKQRVLAADVLAAVGITSPSGSPEVAPLPELLPKRGRGRPRKRE